MRADVRCCPKTTRSFSFKCTWRLVCQAPRRCSSAKAHAWHDKRPRHCPEDMVELLAMLEEDEIDDEEEVQPSPPAAASETSAESAVGADDVAVMSKFTALRWIYGKHPPKRTVVIATFRVARFTLQTRQLWLVGRCRDRPSRALPSTCSKGKTFKKQRKFKKRKQKKTRKKKMKMKRNTR